MNDIEKNAPILETPIVKHIRGLSNEFKPRTNCKMCMSEFRHDAEEEYERTKSIMAVFNFLKKNKESVSYLAVRNHIN